MVQPIEFMVALLGLLGFLSGFSSAWLGVGTGLFIVSFVPVIAGLSPLETLQASLLIVFPINLINSLVFSVQRLVVWSWCIPIILIGLVCSFLLSVFVTSLSPFQVRLILWLFLGFLPLVVFVLGRWPVMKKLLPWTSGFLVGSCSGLTGLGGGIVLSPLLHESRSLPARKIAPLICVSTLFISFFALLGQERGAGVFSNSSHWWKCCFILLACSCVGLLVGHLLNKKERSRLRRLLVRGLTFLMFCIVTGELWIF